MTLHRTRRERRAGRKDARIYMGRTDRRRVKRTYRARIRKAQRKAVKEGRSSSGFRKRDKDGKFI